MLKKRAFCGLVAIPLFLAACTVGPAYVRPDTAPPPAWSHAAAPAGTEGAWPAPDWWRGFAIPELDALMETAVRQNLDVEAAKARIEQARSLARIAGANLFPGVTAGIGSGLDKRGGSGAATSFSLNATASYEVDLWGRNRSLEESASAKAEGSVYEMRVVLLALTADVASLYFRVLTLNDQIETARQTSEDEEKLLAIMEQRYRFGEISGLDLAQARQNLSAVKALIPSLERQREQAENGLALLARKNPGEVKVAGSLMQAAIPRAIPAGLPSELLERRPGIRKAEADLIAAHADMGRAKAELFPTMKLTMLGGYAGSELLGLMNPANAFYSIGADLLTTVFKRERLTAEYDRTAAVRLELLHAYRKAALSAFRDVADALVAIEKLAEEEKLLETALASAERAYALSEIRYRHGLTDFTTVLTADRSRLDVRNNQLQTRLDRLNAQVALYKALGGGLS